MIQEFFNTKGYNLKVDNVIGEQTCNVASDYVINQRINLGYPIEPVMITSIRTDNALSNTFDDIFVITKNNKTYVYACTTTPGDFYIFNPLTVGGITGTAILKPGYYKNSHTFVTAANWKTLWLGMPYFKQTGKVSIYRDNIKDRNLDTNIETEGYFGINIHHMGIGNFINNWSAGCQGMLKSDWSKVVPLFNNGEIISYCLIQA